jgi:GAF domain-containing protein
MTAHSNLDPESFQKLLADAFAVQESEMDAESLSAIVEVQRSIGTGELDVDGTMQVIAERVRNVANATGVAIGLLKGDQLVYGAGSGSAARYVGRQVMATLCVSPRNTARGEILRVENAQTDSRVEAAICRQLGAQSLLILPIYDDRAVAGVLEVLFNETHAFQHREVCSYRLMALLIGEAMSYSARPEQKEALAADLSTLRQNIGQIKPQIQKSFNDGGPVPLAATNRVICKACGASIAEAGKLPALRQSARAASKRPRRVPLYKGRWKTAAVATVLVVASWIANRDRRPAVPLGASALQRSNAIEQQAPFAPARQVSANSTSKAQAAGLKEEGGRKAARTLPQWVRVGNNELDYVAEDITVRYFPPQPPPRPVPGRNNQVRYVSEDVTVRYFAPIHTIELPHPVGSAAHPVVR